MDSRGILVVSESQEDHVRCSKALRDIKHIKYTVEVLPEPNRLLHHLESNTYNALLLNSTYHKATTPELITSIREVHPFLPVIVLTESADEILPVVLIAKGAQDYIDKASITAEKLHNTISKTMFLANQECKRVEHQDLPCCVLIIDDNPDDIEFCTRALNKMSEQYICKSASSANEGFSIMQSYYPDCILLDNAMPGMSGLDMLPEITTIMPNSPVIMLSGEGDEATAVEAMKRGAQNYLVKSQMDAHQLHKSIMAVVESRRLKTEIFRKEEAFSKKHNELSSAYAFQDLMIDALPDFVYVKNPKQRIVRANQAFMSLFPDDVEVIGSTLKEFFKDDYERFQTQDNNAFQSGYAETMETISFSEERKYLLSTQKRRFADKHGNEFILCVSRDVTEREALINQLQTSNRDLEQFVYIASHDLKTPLIGIKRVVGWIKEEHAAELSPALREHFELIKSRTDRITQLLQDLLDYAKVNSKLETEETIDLHDFCQQVFSLVDTHMSFTLHAPHVQVQLPKTALQIVLMNLFSNSIKHHYNHSGSIHVNIEPCYKGYRLSVVDDGPGIPPVYAEKVFQMFQTLKSRDLVEGSGMGLAMVKKVLDHYGGHIALDKDYQQGCQMQIFWPVKQNTLVALEAQTV